MTKSFQHVRQRRQSGQEAKRWLGVWEGSGLREQAECAVCVFVCVRGVLV